MLTTSTHPNCVDFDAELQRYRETFCRAWNVAASDQVLDVGCGAGQTTRDAARLAKRGLAIGVDISAPAIRQAQELADAEEVENVSFLNADAQTHRFAAETFDLIISRFGTMFFSRPAVAFANLARSLRTGGRLAMLVWQAADRNDWTLAIERGLYPEPAAPVAPAQSAFSLGDADTTRSILLGSGFTGITFTDVEEPVYYGPDMAAALTWVRNFANVKSALQEMDERKRERALERLTGALGAYDTGSGIWIPSAARIILARRS